MTIPTVAALHRLTATWEHAPRIVTVSRKPNPALLPQFFGEQAVHNLVADEDSVVLRSPTGERSFADLPAAADAIVAEAGDALIVRFIDPATLRLVRETAPDLLKGAAAAILKYKDETAQDHAAGLLTRAGFAHQLVSTQPPLLILARAPIVFDAAPDYALAQRTRINTLVVLDNNLTGERGHYHSIATRIAQGAVQAGAKVVWAANARLDRALAPKGVEVEPAFATTIFDLPREEQASADLSAEIVAGWRDVAARHDSPTTHYVVPTTDGHFLRAVDALLADGGLKGVIHLSTPYETRHMAARHAGRELDWHLARIAAHPAFGRRVFLWSETVALGVVLGDRLGRPVPALPLPTPPWAMEIDMATAGDPFTIVFLGEARLDKGALELPEIAAALLAGGATGAVRVVVQRVAPFGGFDEALEDAFARLAAIPGVEIVEGALSDAGYRALLARAHAVLLPYRAENYLLRGSGVMIEALAAGRVLLTTDGTVAREYADEGAIHFCRTDDDWTIAVRRILADREATQLRAFRRGRRFAKRYAARSYIDRLAARTEFAAG